MACCCKDKNTNIYDPSDPDNSSVTTRKRSSSFRSGEGLNDILIKNEHNTSVYKQGFRVHSNDGVNSCIASNDLAIIYNSDDDDYHHKDHHTNRIVHNPITYDDSSIKNHVPNHVSTCTSHDI